uniref:Uncharacterized protein n=1 Tax=Chromera velia CCMP2878 TaxID=1169474 RepID=A0A0G4I435_9ALVE|eukprot:Cvel_10822.t1-p1 / transcript=Cvel_10822.t1 / gene=Cvel_10822 / organism=Chromera_velia_CCMP2878 / gene_product=hypothetical protein / transcript_product=hypothetical protein / location=Cvel_scaffold662:20014-23194(-) / protein_length=633 / sequence_SO=supercontig / SO=protein_coding / is_pseudo=false
MRLVLFFLLSAAFLAVPVDGLKVHLLLVGRDDLSAASGYSALLEGLQRELEGKGTFEQVVVEKRKGGELTDRLRDIKAEDPNAHVFLLQHGMQAGAVGLQEWIDRERGELKSSPVSGVVLLSSFLQRVRFRPGMRACAEKASIQPKCELKHPLGILPDQARRCETENKIDFPLPVLEIGGELDGIVRLTRVAEDAYVFNEQTERGENKDTSMPSVVLVPGMNHRTLLDQNAVPRQVEQADLEAERDNEEVLQEVARLVRLFTESVTKVAEPPSEADLDFLSSTRTSSESLLRPLFSAFGSETGEGSWWYTDHFDEKGQSPVAAQAQKVLVGTLPSNITQGMSVDWETSSEFRLLSDEDLIPPYYRGKHRADVGVQVDEEKKRIVLKSNVIVQLRYRQLSVWSVGLGLNGKAVLLEEKAALLGGPAKKDALFSDAHDLGDSPVSALEMGVKLASRQFVADKILKATSREEEEAPASLDDGSLCKAVNGEIWTQAEGLLSDEQRQRFKEKGVPVRFGEDVTPKPSWGPFWIWGYMDWEFKKERGEVEASSKVAFYSLDANPYGAGNHYCKLVSPARAVEWILVDGLKMKKENLGLRAEGEGRTEGPHPSHLRGGALKPFETERLGEKRDERMTEM